MNPKSLWIKAVVRFARSLFRDQSCSTNAILNSAIGPDDGNHGRQQTKSQRNQRDYEHRNSLKGMFLQFVIEFGWGCCGFLGLADNS